MKRIIAILLAVMMLFSLAACGNEAVEETPEPTPEAVEPTPNVEVKEPEEETYESYDARSYASQWEYHDVLYVGEGEAKYVNIPYYSLENVIYCTDPVDETYQAINIYVPAWYMQQNDEGKSSVNPIGAFGTTGADGSILMFTTEEAPIVFVNTISGFAAGGRPTVADGRMGKDAGYYYAFLEQGCVLVTVGARGRTSTDENGECNGKAPNALVDLKSAVRWLKYNDEYLAGDSDRIVTVGVSAGGGMSSLVGTSGDSKLFDSYFEEIGAVDASDSVWASCCYCPVTSLQFADATNWWAMGATESDSFNGAMTRALYEQFVIYMQELGFDLGDDGQSGAFYEDYLAEWEECFDDEIARNYPDAEAAAEFIKGIDPDGKWLTWNENDGCSITSVYDLINNYWGRGGNEENIAPSDALDRSSMEGELFSGNHYSWIMLKALESIADEYPEAADYAAEYKADIENITGEVAGLYDPIEFIVAGDTNVAEHWRFNIGLDDMNQTQANAWVIKNALEQYKDVDVTYNIVYGIGHQSVEADPYDLISWIYECALGVAPAYDALQKFVIVETEAPVIDSGSIFGTYTLEENNGFANITWTLTLNEDFTYSLSETGIVEKTYTGEFGIVDGYICCGPINEADGPKGDCFNEEGGWYSVWTIGGGKCEHADLSKYVAPSPENQVAPNAGAAASVFGTYTLKENNGFADITWTLVLNEDFTYSLSETGIVEKTYTGEFGIVGGFICCGPINEADGPKGDSFGDGWISVWTVSGSSCAHADLSKYVAPSPENQVAPSAGTAASVFGNYELKENNGFADITWTLVLNEDFTYSLSETGIVEKTYTGEFGIVDGFICCGPINEADGPKGDSFGDGWISVWTVSGSSCAHADLSKYVAPSPENQVAPSAGGADADVSGTYTLTENNGFADITWTLELKADGSYSLSETGIVEKTYTGEYWVANGFVCCGPINEADGPKGDSFAEADGWYSVWTVSGGSCAHADLSKYQAK